MKKKWLRTNPSKGFIVPKILIQMKLTFFMLFLSFLSAQGSVFAQQMKVNVNLKNASLETLFRELGKQADCEFLFNHRLIEQKGNVDVRYEDKELKEVLNDLLPNLGLSYIFEDNTIIIAEAQQTKQDDVKRILISGTIKDEDGNLLPGVTIMLKDSRLGTTTDAGGKYSIQLPSSDKIVLVFSFMGMKTQEITYKGEEIINVTMQDDIQSLNDVVITGIFTKRKESYTGAVREISETELKQFKGRNLLTTIGNIDPAFNIIPNNDWGSDPNKLPEIQIRGASSLPNITELQDNTNVALNTPLIILDGFETSLQRMMDLDDSEVASITLLKDGSATAIYGSRGTNGVVVITTKEPEPGKLKFYYNGSMNINVPDLTSYHLLNAKDKLELERLSGYFESSTKNAESNLSLQRFYNELLAEVHRGVNTYWLSKPLTTSVDQRHNLRIEGGDQSFRYSLSFQYNSNKGVMKRSYRDNYNGTINLSYKHEKLIFRNNLTIGYTMSEESPYGSFSEYAKLNPYWKPYDEEGNIVKYFTPYNWHHITISGQHDGPYQNPMYDATLNTYNKSDNTNITNNFSIEYTPIQDLYLRGGVGITSENSFGDDFKPAEHSAFSDYRIDKMIERGSYVYSTGRQFNYSVNLSANYSKLFTERHLIYAGINLDITQNKNKNYSFKVEGFPDESLDFLTMALQYPENGKPSGSESTSRRIGLVGNANYSYMDKYLLDISYRTDGSSQFGNKKRFAPFYSIGIGWNLHYEEFMNNVKFIDRLKLRASYGMTGSQQFSAYQAQETYSYYIGDRYNMWLGAYQLALGNENLEWQKTDKYNIGLELNLLNNWVMLETDFYLEKTGNLLSSIELPYSNGFSSYVENIGEVEQKGFELKATVYLMRNTNNNIFWSVTGNLVHNKDKIVKLSEAMKEANEQLEKNFASNPNRIIKEGDSQNAIYVVKSLGIDPSNGKELYLTKDGDITYLWNPVDRIKCGNSQPKFWGNFSTLFRYRDLSLNASFNYLWGGQKYNSTIVDKVENADKILNVDKRVFNDRWKEPGDISFYRGLNEGGIVYYSSRFVQDEAVFACQNIYISYEMMDKKWLRNLGIESMTVGANTGELFYFSTIRRERGIDYPFARQFTFSLGVRF